MKDQFNIDALRTPPLFVALSLLCAWAVSSAGCAVDARDLFDTPGDASVNTDAQHRDATTITTRFDAKANDVSLPSVDAGVVTTDDEAGPMSSSDDATAADDAAMPPRTCDESSCDHSAKDGCCPKACNSANDLDCSVSCGNGIVEAGETCDPPGTCPSSCSNRACTPFELQGSAAQCTAHCVEKPTIKTCVTGDGCCPTGCTVANDNDCAIVCGDGVKSGTETCDPLASCPTSCAPVACQLRKLVNAGTCTAECINDAVQTKCQSGDGCCPAGCNANNDGDCAPKCGNGVKEGTEVCDGNSPTTCANQGCAKRALQGSASSCNAQCVAAGTITACTPGDGCCAAGCNANNDGDCAARCGNGVKEGTELCDGNCPTSCANQGCTKRSLQGAASTCNAQCVNSGTTATCANNDGCCPGTCNANNDNDCNASCGNGVVESGELCDGNCPTSCAPVVCKKRTLSGSVNTCNAKCVDTAITTCVSNDGCCPPGCDHSNDTECPSQCTNGTVECAADYSTVNTCLNGVWRKSSCPATADGPGGCVPFEDGPNGLINNPRCGCRPQACSCLGSDDIITTSCGLRGFDEQLFCSDFGFGACPAGAKTCTGGKPNLCP